MSVSAAGQLLTVFALSGAIGVPLTTLVGNKLGGVLADRFGIRRVIVPAIAAQVVMLVVLYTLNGPTWLVVASVILWGIFSWIPSPNLLR